MEDFKSILILGSLFLLLFVIAELLHRKLNIGSEVTRKIVHIFTGLLSLLFPLFFDEWWPVALLCGSFLIILIISQRTKQLSSINKISRRSYGSVLYPISVFICFIVFKQEEFSYQLMNPICFYCLPILLLAICDPSAAFAGSVYKKNNGVTDGKTWAGTIAFFIAALIIAVPLLYFSLHTDKLLNAITSSIFIAASTAAGERFSKNGWDNLVIPLVTISCLYLFSELA